jgi:hypothetical protein
MKEISKKDLMSLVTENQSDINEMGYVPRFVKTKSKEGRLERGEGEPKFDKKTGQWIAPKASRVQDVHHPTMSPYAVSKKGEKTQLPMCYVVNTEKVYGKGTIICAIGHSTEEELMKNTEFTEWFEDVIVPKIGKQTPENSTVYFIDFIEAGAQPYPQYLQKAGEKTRDYVFDKTGVDLHAGIGTKDLTQSYFIKTEFRPPMEEFMRSTAERLFLAGFPPVNYPTQVPGHQKRGTNTYAPFENHEILFQTHSVYTYEDYDDFKTKAIQLLKLHNYQGDDKEVQISDAEYQARQYNAGANWKIERKQIKTDVDFKRAPLTKVYKLDKRGMKADEKDYLTNTEFSMYGSLFTDDNGYTQFQWEGEINLEVSEKLREESGGNLQPQITFSAKGKTDYTGGIDPNEGRAVLENPKVKRALNAAFQGLVSDVMKYDPTPDLKVRVFKTRDQVTKAKMNESEIRNLVKSVIRENKGDYETYHNSYTSAINAAKAYAEKKGYEINDDDSFTKIGMGPKKPSEGKTNRFSIELSKDGKVQKKQLHIQVYGMKSKYELNAYIS